MKGITLGKLEWLTISLCVIFSTILFFYSCQSDLAETVDYNLHVRPILSDRCFSCHGPDKAGRKADLRLDTEEGLFSKLENGEVPVSRGSVKESVIMHRIYSDDPEFQMPPPEANLLLKEEEIDILEKWIQQGAEWKPHWSFIPPEKPNLPKIKQKDWPKNEVDYFVLDKLEREGLAPSSEADKETLLRRLSLDLTGLPPTLPEIDAFLADASPDAYEKIVDRLLNSSNYGEHMAVDWLDLSRYADTHGYQADYYRPHWPWRDWVVKAFNDNLPYDEFVTWQLAGDLLPNASREQVLATGFNRNHAQNAEGGIVDEEFRIEYVADRTQTFGTAFLGLTMQCARCHDHKYDPISQKEFFQLFSFFNNVAEAGQITWYKKDMPGPTLLLPDEELEEKIAFIKGLQDQQEEKILKLEKEEQQAFLNWLNNPVRKVSNANRVKGLVAHYALENARGDRITNSVAGGNDGKMVDPLNDKILKEVPIFVKGSVGKGLTLPGDVALSFPGIGRFSRADAFSIGLWVNIPNELENGVIFHSNKGTALYTYKGYQVSVEEGHFDIRLAHDFPYNAIHLLSEDLVPRDKWVHLMLTYDGSSNANGVQFFLNGELISMQTKRDNLYKDIIFHPEEKNGKIPVNTHLKVGARWRGKGFTNGQVDEITVFNRTLTAIEVNQLIGKDQLGELLSKQPIELTKEEKEILYEYYLSQVSKERQSLEKELAKLRRQESELVEWVMEVMVMDEMNEKREAFILDRGAYDQPLEAVDLGTPEYVLPYSEKRPQNRLGLAKWLFDSKNPLPSRVTVNRFWQHYFGLGLVRSTEDFGNQGDLPSHPRLFDWLSKEFMESGWDVKALQKKIVLSATYRQSSLADSTLLSLDPENILLARGPSNRLSAETLRDLVLSASGLLVNKVGGPPVKPYQPEGLWDFNKMSGKYNTGKGEDLYRRSLYTFWKRTIPPPSMNIFDAPTRSYCVVKREKTATPLQALVMMNDPQVLEAARVLAQRMIKEGGNTTEDQITFAFRLLTGRFPQPAQIKVFQQQYEDSKGFYAQNPDKRAGLLEVGEYPMDDSLDPIEVVAFTTITSTMMNFDATIKKR